MPDETNRINVLNLQSLTTDTLVLGDTIRTGASTASHNACMQGLADAVDA